MLVLSPGHVYDGSCRPEGRRWVVTVYRDGRPLRRGGSTVRFSARSRRRAERRAARWLDAQVASDTCRAQQEHADTAALQRFEALTELLA